MLQAKGLIVDEAPVAAETTTTSEEEVTTPETKAPAKKVKAKKRVILLNNIFNPVQLFSEQDFILPKTFSNEFKTKSIASFRKIIGHYG
jgi:hypothetical protein